jgi:hypothetical protein
MGLLLYSVSGAWAVSRIIPRLMLAVKGGPNPSPRHSPSRRHRQDPRRWLCGGFDEGRRRGGRGVAGGRRPLGGCRRPRELTQGVGRLPGGAVVVDLARCEQWRPGGEVGGGGGIDGPCVRMPGGGGGRGDESRGERHPFFAFPFTRDAECLLRLGLSLEGYFVTQNHCSQPFGVWVAVCLFCWRQCNMPSTCLPPNKPKEVNFLGTYIGDTCVVHKGRKGKWIYRCVLDKCKNKTRRAGVRPPHEHYIRKIFSHISRKLKNSYSIIRMGLFPREIDRALPYALT